LRDATAPERAQPGNQNAHGYPNQTLRRVRSMS
jgi:hypothetical protein